MTVLEETDDEEIPSKPVVGEDVVEVGKPAVVGTISEPTTVGVRAV